MRINKMGVKNPMWKGDKVTYRSLHNYISVHKIRYNKCEKCSAENIKTCFANKDNKYTRNIQDWIELCYKCHKSYDKNLPKGHKYEKETLRKYRKSISSPRTLKIEL